MRDPSPAGSGDALTTRVATCLLTPEHACSLTLAEWNSLLQALRRNALLGTFAERLAQAGLLDRVPAKALAQLRQARIAAASARTAVRFEANRMLRALRDYDGPLVLLKGAAYEFRGLAPAAGRITGDLDVLVPRARLDDVETRLVAHGWRGADLDPYDERHYRERSHEIPPLLYPGRATPIDLHHTIAPLTSRVHPDAGALFAQAVPTTVPRLSVLGPADMVLHSALHLCNDEVGRPLRDLFDIHLLVGEFADVPPFWDDLRARAELHGLQRPLYYVLRMLQQVFSSPVPARMTAVTGAWGPSPALGWVMERLLRARFAAGFAGSRRLTHRAAENALYVRAHWLRMPPLMLGGHLARKAFRRTQDRRPQRTPDDRP